MYIMCSLDAIYLNSEWPQTGFEHMFSSKLSIRVPVFAVPAEVDLGLAGGFKSNLNMFKLHSDQNKLIMFQVGFQVSLPSRSLNLKLLLTTTGVCEKTLLS